MSLISCDDGTSFRVMNSVFDGKTHSSRNEGKRTAISELVMYVLYSDLSLRKDICFLRNNND